MTRNWDPPPPRPEPPPAPPKKTATAVQTSTPTAPTPEPGSLDEAFDFRVAQALASKRMGSIEGALRWLDDAAGALRAMQKERWAAKEAEAKR